MFYVAVPKSTSAGEGKCSGEKQSADKIHPSLGSKLPLCKVLEKLPKCGLTIIKLNKCYQTRNYYYYYRKKEERSLVIYRIKCNSVISVRTLKKEGNCNIKFSVTILENKIMLSL